ncbi:MAG TPA: AbrB family transcriptional regulator [Holophaga sp.]|nr:AbrB family transcriptional regulator [Holophaga sp.]HPS67814.1 AbrB family transcriptional regulator [Holophaga sp.]
MTSRKIAHWGGLAAVSLPLVWLARAAGLPAAFLLGALIGAIVFGLARPSGLKVARPAFVAVQALLGCAIARTFTPSFLDSMKDDGGVMLLVALTTILAGALVGWLLVRHGVLPGTTAAWGSSPGGASAMVAMAEEYGADERGVAFMQYLRVVLVILTATVVSRVLMPQAGSGAPVPLWEATPLRPTATMLALTVVGGLVGVWSRIPAGALIFSMVLGGALHVMGLEMAFPSWLLALANIVLGWKVGLGFDRDILRYALRALPQLLGSTLLLIALCAGSSWVLTRVLHLDPLTAYLATSPGGIDSVAMIALGSGTDVSFVMTTQALRLFMVILLGPRIAKWLCRFA